MTPIAFQAHVGLLQRFLAQRDVIVERLQALLNAQQRPPHLLQDRALLSRQFEECFFVTPTVEREQLALRGALQAAHWAEGFRPRDMPGIPNEMFDPADLVARAFQLWQHTRWPGRNGRIRFAHTLFNLYIVRNIALLQMRIWDEQDASPHLSRLQQLLDGLWKGSPRDQPVLVRDVRWLVPVAQSPTTDALGPYFEVAARIAQSLSEAERLEIHRASVVMAGGHLRSQLRHFNMQGTALDDPDLRLRTRRSNALDCAMTIQGLVPLLQGYARAVDDGDTQRRGVLAGAICQGISPDPELFVNRLDLLRAYSMIEHLFVQVSGNHASYTAMGQRHLALVDDYAASMTRLAPALAIDVEQFAPAAGSYSPYGVMYGFSSNLLEHMTMKALQPEAETRFSLEDVFAHDGNGTERLAWVSGWRQLPHMSREVQQLYAYPQAFAESIFDRVRHALAVRAAPDAQRSTDTGRLFLGSTAPALASQYVLSSDPQLVAAGLAQPCEPHQLLIDRNEGEFAVSYQTAQGWLAISKDFLTAVLGAGHDASIAFLPPAPAAVLKLMCAGLVAD